MQMGGGLFWGGVGGGGEPVVGTELISEDLAFLGLIQELGNFRLAGYSTGIMKRLWIEREWREFLLVE